MKRLYPFLFLILLLPSCAVYQEVEVTEVLDVTILEFGKNGVDCDVYLSVKNPNRYDITLTSSHIDLVFEGSPLGAIDLNEPLVIPKHSQSTIKMKCKASYESVQAITGNLIALLFKNEYSLRGTGYIEGKGVLIRKRVPVEFETRLSREDLGF